MDNQTLKKEVQNYWNKASCGTEHIRAAKFSHDYFQAIEASRYAIEPEIFSFAQFTRYHGKKVLEVGVGAGTDFTQWVRAGAVAHGIDLTQEAIENTRNRLALYNLSAADLQVADAEAIPHPDDSFDLVYSWGVIHHSPNTIKCLEEIIRVTKPGGTFKIMIYNKNSLFAFYRYLLCGLKKGKMFARWDDIIFHNQESLGTKAYTIKQINALLKNYPVTIKQLRATVTAHDLLYYKSRPVRALAHLLAFICGWRRCGWFMTIECQKQ